MQEDQKNITAKVIVLGDVGTGKSSIISRFVTNNFNENSQSTSGIDYKLKRIKIDGVGVKLQIWDTAGQEKYKAMIKNFFKNALGGVIIIDLSNEKTLSSIDSWMETIKAQAIENIPMIIMANKMDLEPQIPEQEIKKVADNHGMTYFLCSAKTGENIEQAFTEIARLIKEDFGNLTIVLEQKERKNNNISLMKPPPELTNNSKCNC